MNFLLGVSFCIVLLLVAVWGADIGMKIAVDKTLRDGYFIAYGKKYKAVEVTEQ